MSKKKGLRPFRLSALTAVNPGEFVTEAAIFTDLIERLTSIRMDGGADALSHIDLRVDSTMTGRNDHFVIDIDTDVITVTGRTPDALFVALTTLVKEVGAGTTDAVDIPACVIEADPLMGYRGAHFDVCRHFFGMDEIKTFIDMMALHGLNTFHWHLSDDQGWRIEMKSYPRLTEIGSHRDSTTILRNSGRWDYTPVDGYFTQEQAREITRYAADRHIRIIPEIDLPGHMRAALAAYPHLGCTGGPYSVWTEWGVTDEVLCPGKPATMQFITDVLNELMDIFPDSEIIHIGGDECPKTAWHDCPDCQALIDSLGIKPNGRYSAEDLLQGYVTRHAYEVCKARGRRIIGWDEILQADIPDDAIVMSWQGTGGGREGVSRGNDVVLAPNYCMYFDFYQTKDVEHEPFAIGGFSPVSKVYAFNPLEVVEGMGDDAAKHLLGVQANLWTEYIPTFSHAQYMELPRMSALAEVQWQNPDDKDYDAYRNRLPSLLAIYDRLGWNYARHICDPEVTYRPDTLSRSLTVTLRSLPGYEIRYTLDGTDPVAGSPLYTAPLSINRSAQLRFASFDPKGRRGRILGDSVTVSRSSFAPATLNTSPAPGYAFDGAPTLVDGITGSYNYRTGRMLGFNLEPLDVTIDLGKVDKISTVGYNVAVFACDGVVDSESAKVMVSNDGKKFKQVAVETVEPIDPADEFTLKRHTITLPKGTKARYVRVIINPVASLPAWHSLAGSRAFLFVDEIAVN